MSGRVASKYRTGCSLCATSRTSVVTIITNLLCVEGVVTCVHSRHQSRDSLSKRQDDDSQTCTTSLPLTHPKPPSQPPGSAHPIQLQPTAPCAVAPIPYKLRRTSTPPSTPQAAWRSGSAVSSLALEIHCSNDSPNSLLSRAHNPEVLRSKRSAATPFLFDFNLSISVLLMPWGSRLTV